MQILSKTELLGFIELKIGRLQVQVPVRAAAKEDLTDLPQLANFTTEGDACAILVKDKSNPNVEQAVREAAEDAVKHLSKKLLN